MSRLGLSIMMAACLMACGTDGDQSLDDNGGAAPPQVDATSFADSYELPFGLVQPDRAVPIGRPALYEDQPWTSEGATTLRAAYQITSDDPVAAFREWAGGLDGLSLTDVNVSRPGSGSRQAWLEAQGEGGGWETGMNRANLQLWATTGDPILLVHLVRSNDDPPNIPVLHDTAGASPPQGTVIEETERTAGDELFTEQGSVIHLPEGTRALMPTIPTFGGTGGSTSILAAQDGAAAVRALLDEAEEGSSDSEIIGPVVSENDGRTTVHASFLIPAGGWGFIVVAVQEPGDPAATVYVESFAD